MNEVTPIERTIFEPDGNIRMEFGYTSDMLDKMAALVSKEVDEELMKRIAPNFGYVKEHTCHTDSDMQLAYHIGYEDALAKRKPDAKKVVIK